MVGFNSTNSTKSLPYFLLTMWLLSLPHLVTSLNYDVLSSSSSVQLGQITLSMAWLRITNPQKVPPQVAHKTATGNLILILTEPTSRASTPGHSTDPLVKPSSTSSWCCGTARKAGSPLPLLLLLLLPLLFPLSTDTFRAPSGDPHTIVSILNPLVTQSSSTVPYPLSGHSHLLSNLPVACVSSLTYCSGGYRLTLSDIVASPPIPTAPLQGLSGC